MQAHSLQHYNPLMPWHKKENKEKKKKERDERKQDKNITSSKDQLGICHQEDSLMENNFHKNPNRIFYSKYFNSTVGDIAVKQTQLFRTN